MNHASILDLVYNAALLLAMIIIYDIAAGRGHPSLNPVRQLFTGLALGAIGVVIMLTPWEYAPGIIFDTRSVLLSISGLFFGAIPAAIAMVITGSLRYVQGGTAALTGISVIVASGCLGIAWHYLRRRPLSELTVREFYLFGIAVHLAMLGLMLTLPWNVARQVLSSITFPVLLIYPIITVALGMLFTRRLQRDETAEALRENEFLFRSQFDLGNIGIAITHPDKHWLRVNPRLCHMLGYTEQELLQQSWVDITHPDDLEADLAQHQAMLEDRIQGYSMDKRFIRKNGELLYAHMTIACYRIENNIQFFIAGIIDTTESKEAEAQLRAKKEQLAFVLAGSDLGYWDWDIQTNTIQSNERWAKILGADPNGVATDHQFWFDRIHPDDRQRVRQSLTEHLEGCTSQHKIEYRILTKQGQYKWILDCAKVVSYDENGSPLRMSGTQTDITQRKAAEASMQLASMVYQNSNEAMVVTNSHGQIIDTNPAFTAITGYQPDEVQGKSPKILVSRHQDRNIFDNIVNALFADGCWKGEIEQCRKNGTTYTAWLSINSIYNPDGSVQRRVAQFADITEKKESDQIIWSQANFDALTGLPNRHMFLSQLEQEQRKAHHRGDKVALLFLDLDHFKEINDTLGHHIGDELLKAVAKRLQHCVKETDTVSRLGGDEFTVILSGQKNARGAEQVAQRILSQFARPFSLDVETIYISPSIGITLFPEDGTDADTLLKNADQAMYAAKAQGRNNYRYFTASMQEEALYRRRLGNELRQALGSDQLALHYQPIVDLRSREITKAEALLRWKHPELGFIGPADFIPVAEETGIIVELGDWVFRQAARQVAIWRREFHPAFQISINKSPLQFREQGNDIHSWIAHLRSLGLPGQAIAIEITEGLLLDASSTVTEKLLAFRDAGIQVSLDDFGTGYSSLSYIKKFDVDNIKIDQSFVRNLSAGSDDMAVCEAIIVMAHKLGLEVVAEGIETEGQRKLLMDAGCDYGQGILFSMPKPADAFAQLVSTHQEATQRPSDLLV
ncbi:EAL domain-containing protein [Photobacterium atrarenae]|uniref:EAL domain-containing protein n=1 Tax=Photobacterium atrarenae TaxID=865757 RepID=A0ABY5GR02_9GAMM|nr:EAL domain-containing protein [Photobacterium atrarenae]UTV30688.1 EAL domain-containing protein [Photobacterium atrarenae]